MVAAMHANKPVEHPLLTKVRECSAKPDAVADFFLRMLHPLPRCRLSIEVSCHEYLAATVMERDADAAHRLEISSLLEGDDAGMRLVLICLVSMFAAAPLSPLSACCPPLNWGRTPQADAP